MGKKSEIRKNSRASRRLEQEDLSLEIEDPNERLDDKSRVLREIAQKKLREGTKEGEQGLDSELTAIQKGEHPMQFGANGDGNLKSRVNKKAGSSKRAKQKRERAQSIQDMLKEKVSLAKQRHKTIRRYRDEDEGEAETK